MPLGLQGGFGVGAGVDQANDLRVLLQRELEAKARQEAEAARLAENARQFNETKPLEAKRVDIAQQHVDVAKGGLGLNLAEFDFMKPLRTAESASGVALQGAQTGDIIRRPLEAELGRKHDVNLLNLGQNFRAGESQLGRTHDINLANLTGGQRLAQIAAGGAQDRITRQSTATAGGASDMAALADMVLKNPDLLKDMPPTGRMGVLREIASSGGELANRRRDTLRQVISGAADTIKTLNPNHPGFAGAVGMKGPTSLFGALENPVAGSAAGDYAKYVDTLKSQLTLPKLELMRGLGAMSDREFKTVSDAVTALDRRMSEDQFKVELKKIESGLAGVMKTFGMTDGATGGRVRVQGPDGKTGTVDASEVSTLPAGWKVIGG